MTREQFDRWANIDLAVEFIIRAGRARIYHNKHNHALYMGEVAYHRAKAMEASKAMEARG